MEARVLRWLTFLWLFLGLTILFSASFITADLDFGKGWKLFAQQLLWTGLGLVIFHGVVHLPVKRMVQFSGIGMIAMIGLLLATYVPGLTVCINDSCRWLQVGGGFLLQPSELLKPFLLLQASRLFANWQQTPWQERLTWLGLFAFTLVTILLQPSLSMTALYGSTLWLIAMAAGLPWVQLGGGSPQWYSCGSAECDGEGLSTPPPDDIFRPLERCCWGWFPVGAEFAGDRFGGHLW